MQRYKILHCLFFILISASLPAKAASVTESNSHDNCPIVGAATSGTMGALLGGGVGAVVGFAAGAIIGTSACAQKEQLAEKQCACETGGAYVDKRHYLCPDHGDFDKNRYPGCKRLISCNENCDCDIEQSRCVNKFEPKKDSINCTLACPKKITVNFETNKAIINKREEIDKLNNVKNFDGTCMSIEIIGHADSRGNEKNNHKLGLARAAFVKKQIKEKSEWYKDAASTTIRSMGEKDLLLQDKNNKTAQTKNRRVEIIFHCNCPPACKIEN